MSNRKWRKKEGIRMFVMDVDGTMTDGTTLYYSRGERMKAFNMKDGMGILLLRKNKIIPVIMTTEKSKIVKARGKKLKMKEVHIGVSDKKKRLRQIAFNHKLWMNTNVVYIGDDINDLEAMKECALKIAPADAVDEIKKIADHVCKRDGGKGCVREAIEYVLTVNRIRREKEEIETET